MIIKTRIDTERPSRLFSPHAASTTVLGGGGVGGDAATPSPTTTTQQQHQHDQLAEQQVTLEGADKLHKTLGVSLITTSADATTSSNNSATTTTTCMIRYADPHTVEAIPSDDDDDDDGNSSSITPNPSLPMGDPTRKSDHPKRLGNITISTVSKARSSSSLGGSGGSLPCTPEGFVPSMNAAVQQAQQDAAAEFASLRDLLHSALGVQPASDQQQRRPAPQQLATEYSDNDSNDHDGDDEMITTEHNNNNAVSDTSDLKNNIVARTLFNTMYAPQLASSLAADISHTTMSTPLLRKPLGSSRAHYEMLLKLGSTSVVVPHVVVGSTDESVVGSNTTTTSPSTHSTTTRPSTNTVTSKAVPESNVLQFVMNAFAALQSDVPVERDAVAAWSFRQWVELVYPKGGSSSTTPPSISDLSQQSSSLRRILLDGNTSTNTTINSSAGGGDLVDVAGRPRLGDESSAPAGIANTTTTTRRHQRNPTTTDYSLSKAIHETLLQHADRAFGQEHPHYYTPDAVDAVIRSALYDYLSSPSSSSSCTEKKSTATSSSTSSVPTMIISPFQSSIQKGCIPIHAGLFAAPTVTIHTTPQTNFDARQLQHTLFEVLQMLSPTHLFAHEDGNAATTHHHNHSNSTHRLLITTAECHWIIHALTTMTTSSTSDSDPLFSTTEFEEAVGAFSPSSSYYHTKENNSSSGGILGCLSSDPIAGSLSSKKAPLITSISTFKIQLLLTHSKLRSALHQQQQHASTTRLPHHINHRTLAAMTFLLDCFIPIADSDNGNNTTSSLSLLQRLEQTLSDASLRLVDGSLIVDSPSSATSTPLPSADSLSLAHNGSPHFNSKDQQNSFSSKSVLEVERDTIRAICRIERLVSIVRDIDGGGGCGGDSEEQVGFSILRLLLDSSPHQYYRHRLPSSSSSPQLLSDQDLYVHQLTTHADTLTKIASMFPNSKNTTKGGSSGDGGSAAATVQAARRTLDDVIDSVFAHQQRQQQQQRHAAPSSSDQPNTTSSSSSAVVPQSVLRELSIALRGKEDEEFSSSSSDSSDSSTSCSDSSSDGDNNKADDDTTSSMMMSNVVPRKHPLSAAVKDFQKSEKDKSATRQDQIKVAHQQLFSALLRIRIELLPADAKIKQNASSKKKSSSSSGEADEDKEPETVSMLQGLSRVLAPLCAELGVVTVLRGMLPEAVFRRVSSIIAPSDSTTPSLSNGPPHPPSVHSPHILGNNNHTNTTTHNDDDMERYTHRYVVGALNRQRGAVVDGIPTSPADYFDRRRRLCNTRRNRRHQYHQDGGGGGRKQKSIAFKAFFSVDGGLVSASPAFFGRRDAAATTHNPIRLQHWDRTVISVLAHQHGIHCDRARSIVREYDVQESRRSAAQKLWEMTKLSSPSSGDDATTIASPSSQINSYAQLQDGLSDIQSFLQHHSSPRGSGDQSPRGVSNPPSTTASTSPTPLGTYLQEGIVVEKVMVGSTGVPCMPIDLVLLSIDGNHTTTTSSTSSSSSSSLVVVIGFLPSSSSSTGSGNNSASPARAFIETWADVRHRHKTQSPTHSHFHQSSTATPSPGTSSSQQSDVRAAYTTLSHGVTRALSASPTTSTCRTSTSTCDIVHEVHIIVEKTIMAMSSSSSSHSGGVVAGGFEPLSATSSNAAMASVKQLILQNVSTTTTTATSHNNNRLLRGLIRIMCQRGRGGDGSNSNRHSRGDDDAGLCGSCCGGGKKDRSRNRGNDVGGGRYQARPVPVVGGRTTGGSGAKWCDLQSDSRYWSIGNSTNTPISGAKSSLSARGTSAPPNRNRGPAAPVGGGGGGSLVGQGTSSSSSLLDDLANAIVTTHSHHLPPTTTLGSAQSRQAKALQTTMLASVASTLGTLVQLQSGDGLSGGGRAGGVRAHHVATTTTRGSNLIASLRRSSHELQQQQHPDHHHDISAIQFAAKCAAAMEVVLSSPSSSSNRRTVSAIQLTPFSPTATPNDYLHILSTLEKLISFSERAVNTFRGALPTSQQHTTSAGLEDRMMWESSAVTVKVSLILVGGSQGQGGVDAAADDDELTVYDIDGVSAHNLSYWKPALQHYQLIVAQEFACRSPQAATVLVPRLIKSHYQHLSHIASRLNTTTTVPTAPPSSSTTSSSLTTSSYSCTSQSVTSLSLIPHGNLRNEISTTTSQQQQQHHLPTGWGWGPYGQLLLQIRKSLDKTKTNSNGNGGGNGLLMIGNEDAIGIAERSLGGGRSWKAAGVVQHHNRSGYSSTLRITTTTPTTSSGSHPPRHTTPAQQHQRPPLQSSTPPPSSSSFLPLNDCHHHKLHTSMETQSEGNNNNTTSIHSVHREHMPIIVGVAQMGVVSKFVRQHASTTTANNSAHTITHDVVNEIAAKLVNVAAMRALSQ